MNIDDKVNMTTGVKERRKRKDKNKTNDGSSGGTRRFDACSVIHIFIWEQQQGYYYVH